jgi:hypothetical protein
MDKPRYQWLYWGVTILLGVIGLWCALGIV